jgi:hypothetical protein
MRARRCENAKDSGKLLVDRAEVGESAWAVIKFSSTAEIVYPVTSVDSEQTKTLIRLPSTHHRRGLHAIGDAAIHRS